MASRLEEVQAFVMADPAQVAKEAALLSALHALNTAPQDREGGMQFETFEKSSETAGGEADTESPAL